MKAKSRKARETRAAYRVRTKRVTGKPRARLTRARKPVVPAVRWEERKAATWQEMEQWRLWFNKHASEFEQKYPGKYLAIWNAEIIAVGSTWGQAWDAAIAVRPNIIPLVTYVPTEGEAVLVL